MATNYPAALDTADTIPASMSTPPTHPTRHANDRDAIVAIETLIGAFPSGTFPSGIATIKAWLQGLKTGAQVDALNVSKLTGSAINTGSGLTVTGAFTATGNVTSDLNVQGDYIKAGTTGAHPPFLVQRYGGTLNGSGAATVPHTVSDGGQRCLWAFAWYRGNSGEAVGISAGLLTVDGTNFYVAGGAALANRAWRGAIAFSEDSATW